MTRSRRAIPSSIVGLIALAWSLATPAAVAQTAADVDAARELFKQAAQAAKQGDWEQARDKFKRSLALKSAPITHFSLGVAQKHTGDYVEALENLRAFLVSPSDEGTEAYREPAATAIRELEALVGRVAIVIEPPETTELVVEVDGTAVPRAALGQPRLVNPGEHVVQAEAEGFHAASETVTVGSGESANVTLTLEPKDEPPVEPITPVAVSEPDEDASTSDFPLGPVLLMGGGALVFGAGLTVGLIGLSQAKDAPSDTSPEAEAARTKGLAGDIVAGVGIAAVVGGLIWLLIPTDDEASPTDTATLTVNPWSAGEAAGVELRF